MACGTLCPTGGRSSLTCPTDTLTVQPIRFIIDRLSCANAITLLCSGLLASVYNTTDVVVCRVQWQPVTEKHTPISGLNRKHEVRMSMN
jgi:hypothetical protein